MEVELILSAIRDKQREKDIRQVLKDFKLEKGTRGAVINLLQRCNNLDEDNIKDLNTLLEWTLCDFPFDLDLKKLAEVVQFRNPPPAIKSLRKRMNEDFRDFFDIDKDSDVVTIATGAIKDYFESASTTEYSEGHTHALVTAAEASIVERLLRTMCDEKLYDKLGFDTFFKEKTKTTFKVHVNIHEMHAQVALDCMKGICSKVQLSIRSDMQSAWHEVLSMADPAQMNPDLKKEIGKFLILILYDDNTIDSWQPWYQQGHIFVFGQKLTQILMTLLEDSIVQEAASESWQKGWIKRMCGSTAGSCEKVWLSVVKRMARWWLLEAPLSAFDTSTQCEVFRLIQGFLHQVCSYCCLSKYVLISQISKIPNRKESDMDEDNWYNFVDNDPDNIEEAIVWAKKTIKGDEFSASSLCRIGDMYSCLTRYSQAMEQYSMAEQCDKKLYQATSGKAYTEWAQHFRDEAILTMQSAIKKQKRQGFCSKESI